MFVIRITHIGLTHLLRSASRIICFSHLSALPNFSVVWHGFISMVNFNCLSNRVCWLHVAISFHSLFLFFVFAPPAKQPQEYYDETGRPRKMLAPRGTSSWLYYFFFPTEGGAQRKMDVRQIGLKWTEMEQSRHKWGIGTFYYGGHEVKAGCLPRSTLSSWILILRNDLRREILRVSKLL